MKFDISSLLVKSKEHYSKINTNVSDISSNLSKINTNVSDISDNLSLINTNKNNIINNYNISQINKKKSEFNTTLSDNNKNNISDNLELINTNKSDISKIFELIKNKIPQKTFNKTFGVENKEFKFNRTTHFFEIFSIDIENDYLKDGELRISLKIYYKYKNLSNDITRLTHEYQLYSKDGIINTLVFNHQFFGEADYINNILYVKEDFYIKLFDTYSKLKLILMLDRVNRKGVGTIDLQTYNNNSINLGFIENVIV